MADLGQRTDQAFWTTVRPVEELEPLGVEVDHHCLFPSGVECVALLELILHVAIEMASVDSQNADKNVTISDVVDIAVIA